MQSEFGVRLVLQLVCLGCLAAFFCPSASAQSTDPQGAQTEWWPEIDSYVKLDQRTTFMFEVSRTTDGTNYNSFDVGPTLFFSLRPIVRRRLELNNPEKSKYLTLGVGYRYIPTFGKPTENRVQVELTPRFDLPGSILLSNRFRVDIREIGGKWSWRYRQRLIAERNFKVKAVHLAPYAMGELYYDDRYAIWNKNTYESGVTIGVRRWLDLKPYFAHSNDSRNSIPHVNALGLTGSIYFRNK